MEINNNMPEQYRFYFESTVRMRQNLIGLVKFQKLQSELITSQMIARTRSMQTKCRELTQNFTIINDTYQQMLAEHRKVKIIFDICCEAKRR